MTLHDFIARCDAYCAQHGKNRRWLSRRLFNDLYRINDLANGLSDIGVRRMERAAHDLETMCAASQSEAA